MNDADNLPIAPRPLAIVRSYHDLHEAVRAWSDEIGMTREQLDAEAGLANGHAGKLLSPRAIRTFGNVSLGRVLAALGLVLVLTEDGEAVERIEQRMTAEKNARNDACDKIPPQHWRLAKGSAWGRRMAARRALKLTAEERSASARRAAKARWSKAAKSGEQRQVWVLDWVQHLNAHRQTRAFTSTRARRGTDLPIRFAVIEAVPAALPMFGLAHSTTRTHGHGLVLTQPGSAAGHLQARDHREAE